MPALMRLDYRTDGVRHDCLDVRLHPRIVIVISIHVAGVGRQVARRTVAVAGDHHGGMRAKALGGTLVADERLGGQDDELCGGAGAEVEAGYVDVVARLRTLAPAQAQSGRVPPPST